MTVAEFTTVPARQPARSTETIGLREDTQNPAARATYARERSAATATAERHGAFRHAVAPASAELAVAGAEDFAVVVEVADAAVAADADSRN